MRRSTLHIFTFAAVLLTLLVISGCDKDDQDEIPFAYVNFFIYPNSTLYWEINSMGGWVYLTAEKPSRGVLVYRNTPDEFVAFERTCPHDPFEPTARIEVEPSGITVACPSCNSKFIILDGTPFEGPSKRRLKQYRTIYNGTTLQIFN
jgi:nitrite reductase/ring-hydroxylating ferredoxin subunit